MNPRASLFDLSYLYDFSPPSRLMCPSSTANFRLFIYLYILYARMSFLVPFTQPPGLLYIRGGHEEGAEAC
jgi:hypothetical protein